MLLSLGSVNLDPTVRRDQKCSDSANSVHRLRSIWFLPLSRSAGDVLDDTVLFVLVFHVKGRASSTRLEGIGFGRLELGRTMEIRMQLPRADRLPFIVTSQRNDPEGSYASFPYDRTWRSHETESCPFPPQDHPSRGLFSTFLFLRSDRSRRFFFEIRSLCVSLCLLPSTSTTTFVRFVASYTNSVSANVSSAWTRKDANREVDPFFLPDFCSFCSDRTIPSSRATE